jgi:membrane peptidoglycan carboxypeptidase
MTQYRVYRAGADEPAAAAPQSRRRRRRVIAAGLALLALLLIGLLAGTLYELSLPSVADAPARTAAIVFANHGTLGRLPLPAKLAAAVVAVEDRRFYGNAVVNVFYGAARAGLALVQGGGDQGGSTVSQQLAKRLYGTGSGLGAVLQQVGLGVKLSTSYSRPQVLAMYLNAGYYGNGSWGDVAAARGYFGVSPHKLDWAEAAMLAGLLQAPSAYDPLQHYALAKERQRHVLDRLVANHDLTARQADLAYREALPLRRPSQ